MGYFQSPKSDFYDYDILRDDLDKSGVSDRVDGSPEIYEKFKDLLSKLNPPCSFVSSADSSSNDGDNITRNTFIGVRLIDRKMFANLKIILFFAMISVDATLFFNKL